MRTSLRLAVVTALLASVSGCGGTASDEALDGSRSAGPITVDEGQGFEVGEVKADGGWSISTDRGRYGDFGLDGLTVTPVGTERVWPALDFDLLLKHQAVGQVHCSSSAELLEGDSAQMNCFSNDWVQDGFDEIRVTFAERVG